MPAIHVFLWFITKDIFNHLIQPTESLSLLRSIQSRFKVTTIEEAQFMIHILELDYDFLMSYLSSNFNMYQQMSPISK